MDQGEAHLSKLARRPTLPLGCLLLLPASLYYTKGRRASCQQCAPINVPFSYQSSGPMCPQKGTVPRPGVYSPPRSRPDLPVSILTAWGLEGTGSAEGSSRASPATTVPQSCAQAGPAPARPQKRGGGCASGEGAVGSDTL